MCLPSWNFRAGGAKNTMVSMFLVPQSKDLLMLRDKGQLWTLEAQLDYLPATTRLATFCSSFMTSRLSTEARLSRPVRMKFSTLGICISWADFLEHENKCMPGWHR